MEVVLASGVKMRYSEQGSGTPLICIMGMGASKDLWGADFLAGLAEHYRVITFDNRGVGGSIGPHPVTIEAFAADTVGLLTKLGIEKAHVFGISMGGMIAQQVAVDYPDRVLKLVLGCTTCASKFVRFNPGVLALLIFRFAPRTSMAALVSRAYLKANRAKVKRLLPQMLQASAPASVTHEQLAATKKFDLETKIAAIKVPTLIMHGTNDKLINWQNAEIIARKIPDAKLIIFPGAGHIFPLEKERETLTAMQQFID